MVEHKSIIISDYWLDPSGQPYAEIVYDQDRPTYSRLLEQKGNPIPYHKQPLGFDLRRKK